MRILAVVACAVFVPLLLASTAHARNVIVVDGTGRDGGALRAPEIHPGDTVTYIDYPATVLWPSYDQSVQAGTQALRTELNNAPDGTLVIGYSQGARIVGDVLTEHQAAEVTGVLYSDPRNAGSGVETQINLPGILGATMYGERDDFTVPVESKCIPTDGVCDWSNTDQLESVIGYLRNHTRYFD